MKKQRDFFLRNFMNFYDFSNIPVTFSCYDDIS